MENNRDIIKKFRKLKPGDVIWGARYRTEEHKISIPEGHRAGPYLIVRIEKNILYCLYGTSVKKKSFYKYECDDDEYLDFYFDLSYIEEIGVDRYQGKKFSLKKKEFKKIFALLNKKKRVETYDGRFVSLTHTIIPGDIIKKDHFYLVVNKNNNILRCIILKEKESKLKEGLISKQLSNLECFDFVEIEEDNFLRFIYHIDDELFNNILEKRLKHFEKIKTPQRGSLLIKDNKLYYVYAREGQQLLSYELTEKANELSVRVCINDKSYYINFNNVISIDFNDDFRIRLLATDHDMDEIKKKKQEYIRKQNNKKNKSHKTKDKKLTVNDLVFGALVKIKNKEYYVIISYNRGYITCIKERDLLKGYNNKLILSINDIECLVTDITDERIENNRKMIKLLFYNDHELKKIINYNKIRNIEIGLIIQFNDKLYYVYDVDDDSLYCYMLENANEEEYNIIINNDKFRININNCNVISIWDNFKSVYMVKNEEIINNDYILENKIKTKKLLK